MFAWLKEIQVCTGIFKEIWVCNIYQGVAQQGIWNKKFHITSWIQLVLSCSLGFNSNYIFTEIVWILWWLIRPILALNYCLLQTEKHRLQDNSSSGDVFGSSLELVVLLLSDADHLVPPWWVNTTLLVDAHSFPRFLLKFLSGVSSGHFGNVIPPEVLRRKISSVRFRQALRWHDHPI